MGKILPNKIKPGDTIGVFSPSSPTTESAIEKMKVYFESKGYKFKVAENALESYGFMAGTPEKRANDFNQLANDPDVKMIMTSTGGKSGLHLLPLIDYEAIQKEPKIIVGLSDPAILLNAITAKTGLTTFHGPNGYNFGHTSITEYSESNWWPIVNGNINVPYKFPINDRMRVLKSGPTITGKLYGGHLGTIRSLIGTPWMPSLKGSILFIEEIFTELHVIDTMLAHFKLAGILGLINGLIVGELVECKENAYPQVEALEDILLRNCEEFNFPIVTNIPLGHTDDKITLPIGAELALDSGSSTLELLEAVVA
jgi:muramoyltetrapeptide carboxypeptidase